MFREPSQGPGSRRPAQPKLEAIECSRIETRGHSWWHRRERPLLLIANRYRYCSFATKLSSPVKLSEMPPFCAVNQFTLMPDGSPLTPPAEDRQAIFDTPSVLVRSP